MAITRDLEELRFATRGEKERKIELYRGGETPSYFFF